MDANFNLKTIITYFFQEICRYRKPCDCKLNIFILQGPRGERGETGRQGYSGHTVLSLKFTHFNGLRQGSEWNICQ